LKYKTDFPVIINLPQRFTVTISAKPHRRVSSAVSCNISIAAQEDVRSLVMNIYPVEVVSKDVLKSFRNLLQSGDRTSVERLVEDLDILWTSVKVVKR